MYKTLEFAIEGVSPLLCHNGRLANPLDGISKAIKEISGKRKKTDSDYAELARLEFFGGLYLDGKSPVIPGENIEAMFIDAARKQRLGEQAKAGIISDGPWKIDYDGPKDPEVMWRSGKFTDTRRACLNGKSSVMRTRPIFRKWGLVFRVGYEEDLLNRENVVQFITTAQMMGLGDYTPKYGRFQVKEIKDL